MSRFDLISFKRSIVLLVSARAMPAVGSSSNKSLGSCTRHMAISRRRLSPRDKDEAVMLLFPSIFTSSKIISAVARMSDCDKIDARPCILNAPSRLAKQGIITFSITVKSPKISGVWKTRLMPSWLISYGLRPKTEWPSKSTVPESGISFPTSTFSKVDLPAPLGPMIACTVLAAIFKFTLPKA